MTYTSNSVTETLITAIQNLGGPTPTSYGLGELLRDFDNAIAAFNPEQSNFIPVLNIVTLGADPTGTFDSSFSIKAALALLPSTGGIIYVPAGTYRIDSTIPIGNGVDGSSIQPAVAITSIASVSGSGGFTNIVCNVVAPGVLLGSQVIIAGGSGTGWTGFGGHTYTVDAVSPTQVTLITGSTGFSPGSAGAYTGSSAFMTAATLPSTKWGQQFVGVGNQADLSGATDGGTKFVWGGASNGTMFEVNGPLSNWGMQGITLDGNGAAASCLVLNSATDGYTTNLTMLNFLDFAVTLQCFHSSPGFLSASTTRNRFTNTIVQVNGFNGGNTGAFILQGTSPSDGGLTDPDFNYWNMTTILILNAAGANCYGFDLRYCDNNRFDNTEFFTTSIDASSSNVYHILFDYTEVSAGPSDNIFDHVDFQTTESGHIVNDGSASGATYNRIINVASANGQPPAPGQANLLWGEYQWGATVPGSFSAFQTLLGTTP